MALTVSACCARIVACGRLPIAFPGSRSYNATQNAYWSLQEASISPACIVSPRNSQDVADLVAELATWNCAFAIKGQGHAPAAGFANIADAVTIDMASLKTVSVNSDHSVAIVGAGASWLDVYAYLDPLGKTVAGGRNGQVGVGGLTLGGGISYFSPQVGFTCDTAIDFEIALASGHLINANANSHSDLYRALKGGGNNFGVITRIEFATVPIGGEILGGFFENNFTHRQAAFEAFTNLANATRYDVHASIVMSTGFNLDSKQWRLLSIPVYTLPVARPAAYRELFAVPNITDTLRITRLSLLANESAIPVVNQAFYTGTYRVSSQLMERMINICNSSLYNANIPGLTSMGLAFEPFPTVFASRGVGKNALGISPSEGNAFIILLSPEWTNPSSNQAVSLLTKNILQQFNDFAREMGLLLQYQYANYADLSQEPLRSYGTENFQFLRTVARRYDSSRVFQRQVPGGFKL